jgi:ADP-ribose pyrophosphatase YjhB (NUDIX family)
LSKKQIQSSRFGVYAVLRYKDKLILIKKGKGPFKGRWDLPGGKIDFGETPQVALEREIMEETGLKIKSCRLYDAVGYNKETEDEFFHHVGIIYECVAKRIKKLRREPDGKDSFGAEIFSLNKVKKLKLTPLAKMVLR